MCSSEMKPCVCGCEPRLVWEDGVVFVLCDKCGKFGEAYRTELSAVRSWNKKIKREKGNSANE